MNTKTYNKDNLRDDEIDIIVTRVKIYLVNSNNEIMMASSNGGLQLPGGHVEDSETEAQACIREIKEETGIDIDSSVINEPFFEIKHYTKNYKDQGINRVARIVYYFVKTDKKYEKQNTSLTENEKLNKFTILSIPFDNFENELSIIKNTNEQEINRVIAEEILESFNILKSTIGY